ncbi:MAG: YggT family protein [Gammaproteobacteria bacterium]|nr:YggT family protein [Gammaproteobacteria bacterium]MBQ0774926.1 YggT family protein [Gammaproteobacteria bacterium]
MDPKGAFLFLLFYAFDVYIFLVLTRFLLQLVRADFYNPISQFVVKATNPPLKPLRKLIPGYGGVDVAALVLVVALVIAKILTIQLVGSGSMAIDPLILMTAALHEIARLMLNYLFWSIVLRIVLSWIAPDPYNPMVRLVTQITEPVMAPARRLLPPMGGFDLSPILVIIAIQAVQALFRL